MVIWVCEASEVNNLTVLAVGPNGHNNKDDDEDDDKIAYSRSDPPMGSDKNYENCYQTLLDSEFSLVLFAFISGKNTEKYYLIVVFPDSFIRFNLISEKNIAWLL